MACSMNSSTELYPIFAAATLARSQSEEFSFTVVFEGILVFSMPLCKQPENRSAQVFQRAPPGSILPTGEQHSGNIRSVDAVVGNPGFIVILQFQIRCFTQARLP